MIPDYESIMFPILRLAGKGEIRVRDAVNQLAEEFKLTAEEREELLPSGRVRLFYDRVNWAKTYLKQAGLLVSEKRGHFSISDEGKKALSLNPDQINTKFLRQYPKFNEFKARERKRSPQQVVGEDSKFDDDNPEEKLTPEEKISASHAEIKKVLELELLDEVMKARPIFFEKMLVKLLIAMGYGKDHEDSKHLGKSGDDGVDGVVYQDQLGVDRIYFQAKRYAEGSTVGSGAIREFGGSINIHKATKGIFFTTSKFSSGARKTVAELSSRVVLVDGMQLADLMIRYSIGCREKDTLILKEIDQEFFENE